MKKITQFLIIIAITFTSFAQNEITYIDFGNANSTTEGLNYNNVVNTTNSQTGITISLINSEGTLTGAVLEVTDGFHLNNTAGTQTPDTSLPFSISATRDSFYGETSEFNGVTESTGGFTITGLDITKFYSFSVFASRNSVSDNREALYTITGLTTKTATLDAANNTANTADIFNVSPSLSGVITLQAEPGPNNNNNNGFYYLGAIEMTTSTVPLSINGYNFNNSLSISPNPVDNFCDIRFNLQTDAFLDIAIYDLNGRIVSTLLKEKANIGEVKVSWDRSANNKIAGGVYILKIKANDKVSTSKLLIK